MFASSSCAPFTLPKSLDVLVAEIKFRELLTELKSDVLKTKHWICAFSSLLRQDAAAAHERDGLILVSHKTKRRIQSAREPNTSKEL